MGHDTLRRHCTATHSNTVKTHESCNCNTLQHCTASHCITLRRHCTATHSNTVKTHESCNCNILQHCTASHCNTLRRHCTATQSNTVLPQRPQPKPHYPKDHPLLLYYPVCDSRMSYVTYGGVMSHMDESCHI